MRATPTRPGRIVLTRRGRLLRSGLIVLTILLIIVLLVFTVRSFAVGDDQAGDPPEQTTRTESTPPPSAADTGSPEAEPSASPTGATPDAEPEAEAETDESSEGMVRSGTVGDGTWALAEPATDSEPTAETVHTYALQVEDGTGIDADDAAQEVAGILADPRGWQTTEGVGFQQLADPEQADFTISIASPPTVDEMCLPAQTDGLWSCRIGPDVVLNSDRWLHLTPTYDDTAEYRAYLVNHEVGHFLGHGHTTCEGEGLAASVMLQQSIDLGGCRPNAWPAEEGT